jgi:hypothetical protein
VWGSASTDVWAVGWSGTILHWDGSAWSPVSRGINADLRGVWGSASTDVWAVGWSGTILHWDGSAWSPVSRVTNDFLLGVWGSARTDVWAVGAGGTILHWDGNAWSGSSSGTQSPLYAVWGSASTDVWAVGDPGAILHRQSEATATTTPITDDADSFTGTAGTVLSSYRPGIWQQIDGSAFEMEVSTPTSGATGAGQSLTGQLDANLKVNPWANDQWARITPMQAASCFDGTARMAMRLAETIIIIFLTGI